MKFKISTKLITGLSILAVLAIAVGGVGLFYISKIEAALNEVTDYAAPTVETADDLVMNIWEANKVAEEVIADEELEDIYALVLEFNTFEDNFLASFQELSELVWDPELLDELDRARELHSEFIRFSNDMFRAHITELNEEINADDLLDEFDKIGASLIARLDKLSDENEAEMAKVEEEADRLVQQGAASADLLNDLIGSLFEEDYPVVEASLKLQRLVVEMQDTAGEYMATETEKETQKPANDFKELTLSAKAYFNSIHQFAETTEDKRQAKIIEAMFNDWVTTASKEEQLFDTHLDMLKAEYNADNAAESLELEADAVAEVLDVVIAKADTLSTTADDIAAEIVTQAQTTALIFVVTSIFVTLALIIMVIRSVTTPISKMTLVMEELANRNFNVEIPDALRSDEIGDMAAAVVVFRNSMIKADQLAYYDVLTGLPNRTLFYSQLNRAFNSAQENMTIIALLILDLDDFKIINDAHGHAIGDDLLKNVAQRLLKSIEGSDIVARLGGDEFTIILPESPDIATAMQVASAASESIIKNLSSDYKIGSITLQASTSLGIALYPQDGTSVNELVKHADTAMYQAKESGKSCYRFFSREVFEQQSDKLKLIDDLNSALKEGQFELHYQPQVSLHSNDIVGFEALIRWNHPEHGLIFPDKFIPFAEETGQIIEIGDWVIKAAMLKLSQWQVQGRDWMLSVNLSVEQVRQSGLFALVEKETKRQQFTPDKLCFEITETAMIEDTLSSKKVLSDLKALGFKVSLDDFGTGYSSMTYVKHFPLDELKIDRSFIQDMFEAIEDKAIILASLSLASHLDVTTVAEGVESEEQLTFLKENGCDYIQGYYIAKPMPESHIEDWTQSFAM